jgi:hypothetical protein
MESQEVELTPEIEANLRRFAPIKPDEIFEYVPAVWRNSGKSRDEWPVFMLKPLAGGEALDASDEMRGNVKYNISGGSEMQFNHGLFTKTICSRGIVGWKNYKYTDGSDVLFSKENILRVLPRDLLYELANAIQARGQLTNEEVRGLR